MTAPAEPMARSETARRLTGLRAAAPDCRRQLAEDLFRILPEHRIVGRRYVAALLEADDLVTAEQIVTRLLLIRPTDPALARLSASIRYRNGAYELADREVQLVLHQRPNHRATRSLASLIACARGDRESALAHCTTALEHWPDDQGLLRQHASLLIDLGRYTEAWTVIGRLREDATVLKAGCLVAQGRIRPAIGILTSALEDAELQSGHDLIMCTLIDLLERFGDTDGLEAALRRLGSGRGWPLAATRAALVRLSRGQFYDAATLAAAAARDRCHRQAGHALVVAATLGKRPTLAHRMLRRLGSARGGADRHAAADCWRRGLTGRWLREQVSRPPLKTGVLPSLVELAGEDLRLACRDGSGGDRAELARHRAVCAAVARISHPREGA